MPDITSSGWLERRLTWSRIRTAFEGTGFLALFVGLLCVLEILGADAPDYPDFQTPEKLLAFVGTVAPTVALYYLLPVPFVAVGFNLAPRSGWRRLIALAVVMLAFAGYDIVLEWPDEDFLDVASTLIPIVLVYEYRYRARHSAAELVRRQIDAVDLDARVTQSRMQLLRAQIEPHFLFNTLANVRCLAQEDASRAAEVLGYLIRYLQAALPHVRSETNTLADEVKLLDAYLSIHQLRMGTRLTYEIQIPSDASPGLIPSMMLLTLIENSIKHGINPLTQGGHILVRAARVGGSLEIAVADSGRGVSSDVESGAGTGLANIRARLHLRYGYAAQLLLARGSARGFTATLRVPWIQR